jgi:hypothetical protein
MGHSRIFGRIWGGTFSEFDNDGHLFGFGREVMVGVKQCR